ncbi:NUDIX hydrolase [Providencia sneebia DSM 19967]|uniref:NUDIX hydrolase n=1 Tax=Providencia sneebia DSM 19967 TaxID=1141660 RepID=K8WC87_9GAMM|nr:NUDIX hydrolase [Providencia sneebia DSM 19967]
MDTKTIDKLGLITISERKVAMVRSYNRALFYIPGGKREPNETDEQALCREHYILIAYVFMVSLSAQLMENKITSKCVFAVILQIFRVNHSQPLKLKSSLGLIAKIYPVVQQQQLLF